MSELISIRVDQNGYYVTGNHQEQENTASGILENEWIKKNYKQFWVKTRKKEPQVKIEFPAEKKEYGMSTRTKRKIRQKILAWYRTKKRPKTFVTLTIPGQIVTPKEAKKMLNSFITNERKKEPFDYLWVMELQERGQPHFHIFTNKFWNIEKTNKSWKTTSIKHLPLLSSKKLETVNCHLNQLPLKWPQKSEIHPFDVAALKSHRKASIYITKYVTKNKNLENAGCLWNCSKKISALRTSNEINIYKHEDICKTLKTNMGNCYYIPKRKTLEKYLKGIKELNNIIMLSE
jgi:hypothetical protein